MRRFLDVLMDLPKRVFLAHYEIIVHLTTPQSRLDAGEECCARMERRLFSREK